MTVEIGLGVGAYCIGANLSDPTLLSWFELRCYAPHAVRNNPMELISGVAALAGSMILLWYWFRYACLLILTAESDLSHGEEVAEANQLSFREVRAKLRHSKIEDRDCLHKCLERDFAIISYLLKHTPAAGSDNRLEDAVLKIHYRLLSAWFQATRSCMGDAATRALEGMSLVVAHFANAMGERRLAVAQRASR